MSELATETLQHLDPNAISIGTNVRGRCRPRRHILAGVREHMCRNLSPPSAPTAASRCVMGQWRRSFRLLETEVDSHGP